MDNRVHIWQRTGLYARVVGAMPNIFAILSQYISFFPLGALICLILAGFNVPISEDLIIITGSLLCQENPSLLVPSLGAIYAGVIISDFISYWIGIQIRQGAAKNKRIAQVFSPKILDRLHYYLDKYGIFTFIVCRFIPFGVRNALFVTSGIFGLRLRFFALYDITAALISVNTLFFLVYRFGEDIKRPVKIAGIFLFICLVSIVGVIILRLIHRWRNRPAKKQNESR
jgi:membrane protein DedA with SNARE-associated domain